MNDSFSKLLNKYSSNTFSFQDEDDETDRVMPRRQSVGGVSVRDLAAKHEKSSFSQSKSTSRNAPSGRVKPLVMQEISIPTIAEEEEEKPAEVKPQRKIPEKPTTKPPEIPSTKPPQIPTTKPPSYSSTLEKKSPERSSPSIPTSKPPEIPSYSSSMKSIPIDETIKEEVKEPEKESALGALDFSLLDNLEINEEDLFMEIDQRFSAHTTLEKPKSGTITSAVSVTSTAPATSTAPVVTSTAAPAPAPAPAASPAPTSVSATASTASKAPTVTSSASLNIPTKEQLAGAGAIDESNMDDLNDIEIDFDDIVADMNKSLILKKEEEKKKKRESIEATGHDFSSISLI